MPRHRVYLVAGLGNPGCEYALTRHNAGFMVLEALAKKFGIEITRSKFDVLFGRGRIAGVEVILAKPQTYMNRGGPPIRHLADYFRIQCEALVVIHDDIDLAYERLKIKVKGGDGGHKGIRSLMNAFGGDQFARLRVGVGRSQVGADVSNHVLTAFSRDELAAWDRILQTATEAVVTILSEGTKASMNQYNKIPR